MKNIENIVKPMTKDYLKNYPKNRELYKIILIKIISFKRRIQDYHRNGQLLR